MRRAENRGLSAWLPRRGYSSADSIDLAKKLLAKGAKINDRLDYKNPSYNPTHMAVGYFQTISWVGATPFFISSKGCDVEFMKFLLANGADPSLLRMVPPDGGWSAAWVPAEAPSRAVKGFILWS